MRGLTTCLLIFFCLLSSFCAQPLRAQNAATDSIRSGLDYAKNENDKLPFYCDLGWEWYAMNADSAIYYAMQGVKSSTKFNNKEEFACNYNILGLSYGAKRFNQKALDYFFKSLGLYKELKDDKNVARVSLNIADVYRSISKYEEALQYSFAGIAQAEKDKDSILNSSIHRSVSIVYRSMENYKKAEEHVLIAIAYANTSTGKTKGKAPMAAGYSSYGILLRLMKKYEQSVMYHKKSIELYSQMKDRYNAAIGFENLAETYFDKNEINTAIGYYKEAMQTFKELNSTTDEGYELNNIARCKNKLNQYNDALSDLKKAGHIFIAGKTDGYLMETYQLMSETYQYLNNTDKAYEFYKQYITIKDTLQTQEQRNKVLELQTQYESLEKEQKIDELNTEKILQQQILIHNRIVTLIMAAVIGLLIFTGFIFRNRIKLKQQLKQVEIRSKIASDLHDDVGSTLSSIRMYSDIVSNQIKESNPQSIKLLEKIGSNSKEMIENMSDIVWMIKPGNDDFKSIENRMLNFANELCTPAGINFEFNKDAPTDAVQISMEQRRDIYLIFKEAVNNAVKYSGCHNIQTSLSLQNQKLQMRISDDGNGFNTSIVKNGNGLSNMQKRAVTHKGIFYINSAAGKGTEIVVSFPV